MELFHLSSCRGGRRWWQGHSSIGADTHSKTDGRVPVVGRCHNHRQELVGRSVEYEGRAHNSSRARATVPPSYSQVCACRGGCSEARREQVPTPCREVELHLAWPHPNRVPAPACLSRARKAGREASSTSSSRQSLSSPAAASGAARLSRPSERSVVESSSSAAAIRPTVR
eukprot:scaffold186160_cov31-Tisochrysis_lutea.AAC.1